MPSKKNKKKMKESAKSQQQAKAPETLEQVETVEVAETAASEPVKEEKPQAKPKTEKQKVKKPSKVKQKTKEVFSELKKVNWPTFAQVAKKTGVVLVVVLVFAAALLGIHKLLEVIYMLFINSLV
ncbi:MAG: preprotein translocase subunit SecE [Clostridia bacterium]|nr:preprotein translocase subunit SecE [Clostridia bacterium]